VRQTLKKIFTQIGNVFMSDRSSFVASDGKMPFNYKRTFILITESVWSILRMYVEHNLTIHTQRPRKHFESGGALAKKGAVLYMIKIKRFYVVHEPNENFWKYGVSITSEMSFIESLLLQKGHFLSSKRGRLFVL
jgi:hypothetical protein